MANNKLTRPAFVPFVDANLNEFFINPDAVEAVRLNPDGLNVILRLSSTSVRLDAQHTLLDVVRALSTGTARVFDEDFVEPERPTKPAKPTLPKEARNREKKKAKGNNR